MSLRIRNISGTNLLKILNIDKLDYITSLIGSTHVIWSSIVYSGIIADAIGEIDTIAEQNDRSPEGYVHAATSIEFE